MATMIGYVGRQSSGGDGTNSEYGANKYILKEGLRRDWYIYRPSDYSVVRPYPVIQDGIICPSRVEGDGVTDYSILSDAFVVLRMAAFAGLQKNLEFVDYCIDSTQFAAPGQDIQTPFQCLVTGLRKMLPKQGGVPGIGADGLPTPQQLRQIQQSVGYSQVAIVFRGAMCAHRGQPMGTKNSKDGKLFKTVFAITQKGAIAAFISALNQRIQHQHPADANNNVLHQMLELGGSTVQIQKVGDRNFTVTAGYDPNYANTFMREFGITNESQYAQALTTLFGPYQKMQDIFNLLTVEQMVQILKANYPISWIWFGLKDSPYAQFITREEQVAALQDPEMAERFGLPPAAVNVQTPPVQNQPTPTATAAPVPQQLYPGSEGIQRPTVSAYPQTSTTPPPIPVQTRANIPEAGVVQTAPADDPNAQLRELYEKYKLGQGGM